MSAFPADEPNESQLGSLAQAARGKQLNAARWILIVIGVLTVVVNAIQMATLREQVQTAINQELRKVGGIPDPVKVKEIEDRAVRAGNLIGVIMIAMGVLFFVFGLIVKMFPVPVTIISLVLYVGSAAAFAALDPATLAQGVIVKIFIVIALIKAIQAAIAYQKEMAAAAPEPAW